MDDSDLTTQQLIRRFMLPLTIVTFQLLNKILGNIKFIYLLCISKHFYGDSNSPSGCATGHPQNDGEEQPFHFSQRMEWRFCRNFRIDRSLVCQYIIGKVRCGWANFRGRRNQVPAHGVGSSGFFLRSHVGISANLDAYTP
jgi:hypothetical protein